jgi:hypothetical protein|tara:strand:+ start:120 stop:335 length:216 start_codon:yes stop_codon:yes gene_type:complete
MCDDIREASYYRDIKTNYPISRDKTRENEHHYLGYQGRSQQANQIISELTQTEPTPTIYREKGKPLFGVDL